MFQGKVIGLLMTSNHFISVEVNFMWEFKSSYKIFKTIRIWWLY